jgi:TPR repeat protein
MPWLLAGCVAAAWGRAGPAQPVDALTVLAKNGDVAAQYALAQHFNGATGQAQDLRQALFYTQAAAEHGHAQAQLDLAFVYLNGNEQVPKDLAASYRWFAKAATRGSVIAQCMLGDFHMNGWGGARQDAREAVRRYQKAADTQDRCAPKAQFELYQSYRYGKGVRQDRAIAIGLLKRSAEAGNPLAQRALSRAYDEGYGVARDGEAAKWWLKKSREGVAPHEFEDDH